MERNKTLRNNAGFTLTELLVVIFIITLLGAITFANYREGGRQMALQRSAYKLAQDIRRTQEMAIAAKECAPCGNTIPPRYGLYIAEPSSVSSSIFADIDNNGFYFSSDKTVETTIFESGVSYLDVSGNCANPMPNPSGLRRIHITFIPPDPITVLNVGWSPNTTTCSEITITLRFGGAGGPTKSVKINNAGMVEIQ